jgi:hypothetical protein
MATPMRMVPSPPTVARTGWLPQNVNTPRIPMPQSTVVHRPEIRYKTITNPTMPRKVPKRLGTLRSNLHPSQQERLSTTIETNHSGLSVFNDQLANASMKIPAALPRFGLA